MEYRESIEIILRDCRFVPHEAELKRLLPGVCDYLPPLSAIRFSDQAVPRFIWGFPVVHGKRLLWAFHQFLTREMLKSLSDPAYQENLRLLTPAELKEEPYFQMLSDSLLKSLSEGSFLRLDSILWIYLSDIICRRLNQDEAVARTIEAINPAEFARTRHLDPELARLRFRSQERFVDVRIKVLRSLFARNDFANSCMKDVFDEVPNNPLNREMIANRLIYTEREDAIYRTLDVTEAFLVKGYKFAASDFVAINRALRLVISGILQRVEGGTLLPLDHYFVSQFVNDALRTKAQSLPSQGHGQPERPLSPREMLQAEEREKLAYLLSLQEQPARYLLSLLSDADREYFRPIEKQGTIPKELLKSMRHRSSALIFEQLYSETVQDLLRWDFFNALKARLRWVAHTDKGDVCEGRPLDRATLSVDLDSHYELYRRSRYGTAVFFDLVGFTDRTKALTRELQEAAARGDKERFSLSSISLAIQRVFSIRTQLEMFGGIPQGFEGDAILDVFPKALDALRYVTAFADNYNKNRAIRFRPFERPTENPYRDGFRVGMCSGDYSLISIVGRSNELQADKTQERAVGHTINRASRLNSGKRGDNLFLLNEEPDVLEEAYDPLKLFAVHVSAKNQLNNNGFASFEETYLEIREQVIAAGLPWYDPLTREGGRVAGVHPYFRNYEFSFIFEDPRFKRVYLIRRLNRRPILKGLEDEIFSIYEYLLIDSDALKELLQREAAFTQPPPPRIQEPLSLGLPPPEAHFGLTPQEPTLKSPLSSGITSIRWQETVDEEAASLHSGYGISIQDLLGGGHSVARALKAHGDALSAWSERQVEQGIPQMSKADVLEDARITQWFGSEEPDDGTEEEVVSPEERLWSRARLGDSEHLEALQGAVEPEVETVSASPAAVRAWDQAVETLRGSRQAGEGLEELLASSDVPEGDGAPSDPRGSTPPTLGTVGGDVASKAEAAFPPSAEEQASPEVASSAPATPFEADREPEDNELQAVESLEADDAQLEQAEEVIGPYVRLSWDRTPEVRELIEALGAEQLGELAQDDRGGILLVRPAPRHPHRMNLASHLQHYHYAFLRGASADASVQVVIGRLESNWLSDVRLFYAPMATHEPWNLEAPFVRFLEDLELSGFQPLETRHRVDSFLREALRPLPVAFLERLHVRLLRRLNE